MVYTKPGEQCHLRDGTVIQESVLRLPFIIGDPHGHGDQRDG